MENSFSYKVEPQVRNISFSIVSVTERKKEKKLLYVHKFHAIVLHLSYVQLQKKSAH